MLFEYSIGDVINMTGLTYNVSGTEQGSLRPWPVNGIRSTRMTDLGLIMDHGTDLLYQLDSVLDKYKSFGQDSTRYWDRMRFGHEGVGPVRDKLQYHVEVLTLFMHLQIPVP